MRSIILPISILLAAPFFALAETADISINAPGFGSGTTTLNYSTVTGSFSFSGSFDGVSGSGSSSYTRINDNLITISGFNFNTGIAVLSVPSFSLSRAGNSYLGSFFSSPLNTTFFVFVDDLNDDDGDGIPNLSDGAFTVAPPVITSAPAASGTFGRAFTTYEATATGNPSHFNLTGTLPPGLSFNSSNGRISGTPSQAGVFTVFLSATELNVTGPAISLRITIAKATPLLSIRPTASAIIFGQVLGNSVLRGGSNLVVGTWSWVVPSNRPNAGVSLQNIRFTPADTNNFNFVTTNVSLVVNKATPVITWSNPAAITYGTALSATQLRATSSGPGIFTYSPPLGTVLNAGTHTLVAVFTTTNANYVSPVIQTVSLVVAKAVPAITWNNPAPIPYGTALSATQLRATSSVAGTFTYNPPSGTVLNSGTQTLRAVFSTTNANYVSPRTNTVSLVVGKATPVITWSNPAAITYGTALSATQLRATSSVVGTYNYTPASGTVLNAGTHTLRVVFSTTNTNYLSPVTNTVSLMVNKATPVITWSNPAAITYGTALSATQLRATSSVAGTYTYTPASGTVLNAGTNTLRLVFSTTNANYVSPRTNTVSLVVGKATPVITWSNPAAITYGTALSATQLRATSSVAGTYTYTPASGTVLNAGTNTLRVVFSTTNGNYVSPRTNTVSLLVNKATPVITNRPTASAITLGKALSNSVLSGGSNSVAGIWGWMTPTNRPGVLGTNAFAVIFIPSNPTNFNTVTTNVSLVVLPTNNMPMGGNLDAVTYYSPAWVFKDCFKSASTWMTRVVGSEEWESLKPPNVDVDGWPLGVPFLSDGAEQILHTIVPLYGTGTYTFRTQGTGEVEISGPRGVSTNILANGGVTTAALGLDPLYDRVDPLNNDNWLYLRVVASDAGDPIRNIQLIAPGQDSNLETEPFHPAFLASLSPYGLIRFMDWLHTNDNELENWSNRTTEATYTQTQPTGVAHEFIIRLANQTGKHPWICIPHRANDDYVRQLARLYRDTLDPDLVLYVEYSNETWNPIFGQTTYVQDQGESLGLAPTDPELSPDGARWQAGQKFVARRSAEIFNLFTQEYMGQRGRFVAVLATQAANAGLSEERLAAMADPVINPTASMPDVLAIAPYFGVNYQPGDIDPTLPTAEQVVTTISTAAIEEARGWAGSQAAVAAANNLTLVCYEGGQHFTGIMGAENNDALVAVLFAANRDPRMEDRYREYLTMLEQEGVELFVNFNHVSGWGNWGTWGVLEYQDQPESEAPKWRAIKSWGEGFAPVP